MIWNFQKHFFCLSPHRNTYKVLRTETCFTMTSFVPGFLSFPILFNNKKEMHQRVLRIFWEESSRGSYQAMPISPSCTHAPDSHSYLSFFHSSFSPYSTQLWRKQLMSLQSNEINCKHERQHVIFKQTVYQHSSIH